MMILFGPPCIYVITRQCPLSSQDISMTVKQTDRQTADSAMLAVSSPKHQHQQHLLRYSLNIPTQTRTRTRLNDKRKSIFNA